MTQTNNFLKHIVDSLPNKEEMLCQKYAFFRDNFEQMFKALTAFDLQIFKHIYAYDFHKLEIERELEQLLIQKKIPLEFACASLKKLAFYGLLQELMDIAGYAKMDHSYIPSPLFIRKTKLGHIVYNEMLV